MTRCLLSSAAIAPALLLAACSQPTQDDSDGLSDPVSERALDDPIMIDPDLAHQNEGDAALTVGGNQSIPLENRTPEAIADAKERAFALVGGRANMRELPAPTQYGDRVPESAALTAAARAAAQPDGAKCADKAEYSAAWAARLPALFPVYPRGATKEAAGTDHGECQLRVVNYLTPVPLADVLSFYYSRAATAGYRTDHAIAGGDNIVSGTKGGASVVVYGRRLPSGLTEIDLITSVN